MALRWALVPFAALVGILASLLVAIPLNSFIRFLLWRAGHPMPGKHILLFVLPFDGAIAAALFILLGTWAAPRRRCVVALALFLLGSGVAWLLVGQIKYPDFAPGGPLRVLSPIVGTCSGGFLAYVIACFLFRTKKVD